jgi:hypothetical protein
MMGSRGLKGGHEYDMLTRFGRFLQKRPGKAKAAKRSFWKRTRKEARHQCRDQYAAMSAADTPDT